MQINHIIKDSKVNGPGKRYTIWVQGCSIRCKDCSNKDTWNFVTGKSVTIQDLVNDIRKYEIDGITITGGEPLDQFEEVLEFLKIIFPSYNILLTTGYPFDQIQHLEILNYVDILVTGPFIKEEIDNTTSWRGSKNQEIKFLTERSKEFEEYQPEFRKEIKINKETGEIITTGFVDIKGGSNG